MKSGRPTGFLDASEASRVYHPVFGAPRERGEDIHNVAVMERRVVLHIVTVDEHDPGQLGRHAEPGDQIGDPGGVGQLDRGAPFPRAARKVPGEGGVELDGDLDQRGPATRRRSPGRIESCRSRLFIRRTSPALMP